jgi:hypothetical protein
MSIDIALVLRSLRGILLFLVILFLLAIALGYGHAGTPGDTPVAIRPAPAPTGLP